MSGVRVLEAVLERDGRQIFAHGMDRVGIMKALADECSEATRCADMLRPRERRIAQMTATLIWQGVCAQVCIGGRREL